LEASGKDLLEKLVEPHVHVQNDYIGGTYIHKGDILWHENGIVYAYQNSCYYYDLAKKKSLRINDKKKFHNKIMSSNSFYDALA
jgi:hypothetical protein